ncbi:MAG: ABC transporter substrate-binding protein, partial [Caldilineaceae bacterium]|nr:ABC transporter substrate-binding protein [Caldilineaceae bacterium]
MGKHRSRLLALGVTILLSVIAACTQQPISSIMPIPVTAQLPATVSPTEGASDTRKPLASPSPPVVQIVRETIVVTATPDANPRVAAPDSDSPPCKRNGLATENEVVIGAIYPLSNPAMMANGYAMQAASHLAIADINARGGIRGKPLRLIVYDSASNPEQGAQFAERLATIDCVAAITGVFHSDVALAVKEVAVQYHIPVIFADPYDEEVTADQQPEVFRIAPLRNMFTEMMGKWLAAVGDYNRDEVLSAVVLADNSQYGQQRLDRAKELLPPYGIQVDCITVDLPTTDFSPVIARIVALERLP